MSETRVVAVESGQVVELTTPAIVENTSGLFPCWVTLTGELMPPHRGHALQPGERLTLAFTGLALVNSDANVELVVTQW